MSIFDHDHSTIFYMTRKRFDGYDLLLIGVTAIIENYIYIANFCDKIAPKFKTALAANKYFESRLYKLHRSRVKVDTNYARLRAKVIPPHEQ